MSVAQELLEQAPQVGLAEAKAGLSGLVAQVERTGTPCIIMKYNKPAVMIAPLPQEAPVKPRAKGMLAAYADPSKIELEPLAHKMAVMEKYGHTA